MGKIVMTEDETVVMAQRLREWVKQKYGRWITHATAMLALRFILRGKDKERK